MRTPVSGLRGKARIEARRAWQPAAWAGIDGRGSGGQRSPARASFRDTQASLQKKRAASGLGLGLRGQGGGQAAEPRSPQLPGFLDVEAEAGCLWSCSGRASRWAECSPAARGKTPKQPWPRERLVPEPQERLMFHLSSLQGRGEDGPKCPGDDLLPSSGDQTQGRLSLSLASTAGMFFMQQCISSSRHMSQLLLAATVAC